MAGFRPTIGEPHGQVSNHGLSLPDGSRLHVWTMRSGAYVTHRDRFDPDRSIPHALAHVATETSTGRAFMVCGGIALALRALRGAMPILP